jgi:hypothetical protein
MREQIDRMASQAEFGSGGEHDEVLDTYRCSPMTKAGAAASTRRSIPA